MNWTKLLLWQLEIHLGMALIMQNLKNEGDGRVQLGRRYCSSDPVFFCVNRLNKEINKLVILVSPI